MDERESRARALARMFVVLADSDFDDEDRLLCLRLNSPVMQEVIEYFNKYPWNEDDEMLLTMPEVK